MNQISKSQVKFVRSLQQKKFRDEYGLFVAEGNKCIEELLKTFEPHLLINYPHASSVSCSETELEQMSSLRTPQGSLGIFRIPKELHLNELQGTQELILVLDGIQDPGNLGTIIRTCDWFGVRHIVCSMNTADCYNPKVVQATMGALARVRVEYTDLVPWLKQQECPIYGTFLDGKNMYHVFSEKKHSDRAILIMGNEGNGISPAVRACVTDAIRIPSYPADAETSESLNVAIATAVVLAEFRRL